MTEQAKALGLGDRLGLEKHLANRIRRADSEARNYLRFMRAAIERNDEQNAHKWAALAESARGRGDKVARAYFDVVTDRERRADLERRERLAEQAIGRKSTRAVA